MINMYRFRFTVSTMTTEAALNRNSGIPPPPNELTQQLPEPWEFEAILFTTYRDENNQYLVLEDGLDLISDERALRAHELENPIWQEEDYVTSYEW